MASLRIGFAGTPDFSVAALEGLIHWCATQHDAGVCAVWTQPDRRAGRGRPVTMSPVKTLAQKAGIPVFQPPTLRDETGQAEFAAASLDLLVVVAYGLILPGPVLSVPRLGCINVHASLLPRWRGAAPIQRAILAGDRVTGVGIMQMDTGLDTGPVWESASLKIASDETGITLHDRLAALGARQLCQALPDILTGCHEPTPQDDSFATYAGKLSKAEARIDWSGSALGIQRKIRAFNAWPVADTLFAGRQLRIWEAELVAAGSADAPGRVVATDGGLRVACGDGQLLLTRVQLAGGKAISATDFVNAHACAGCLLGSQ